MSAFASSLLEQKIPFLMCRFPNQEEILTFQLTQAPARLSSLKDLHGKSGFIVHPFSNSKPMLFFEQIKQIRTLEDVEVQENRSIAALVCDQKSTTKDEYLTSCESLVEDIQKGHFDKVVLSKVGVEKDKSSTDLAANFNTLCEKYPTAFSYMIYYPEILSWMGATPETLMTVNHQSQHAETVSLAGTRKALGSNEKWGEKEMDEQAFVTDYIAKQIERVGITEYRVSDPKTIKAGVMEHLCSRFNLSVDESTLLKLVERLHPTPAVCGMPKSQALQRIIQEEQHDRKYYSGFLGFYNFRDNTNLYVNLRCAEGFDDAVVLYTGGGITKDSNPEDEWNEAALKQSTIKTVLFQGLR